MPVMYKCPRCGTLNPEGVSPFPLCSKCGENLVSCRYCRFFNARTLECTHPLQLEIQTISDPDTIPASCDLFRSRLIMGEVTVKRSVARILGTSILAGIVLVLILWAIFLKSIKKPPLWEFQVDYFPRQLAVGNSFTLTITLTNRGNAPLSMLSLRVPTSFFEGLRLVSALPMTEMELRGLSYYFSLPYLAVGQGYRLQLNLLPLREGSHRAPFELLSGPEVIDTRMVSLQVAGSAVTPTPATPAGR